MAILMSMVSSVHAPLSSKMEASCGSSTSAGLFYITKNGATILLRAGHQYYARRKHKSGLEVWGCRNRKLCRGLVRIKAGQILEETPQLCTPEFANNEIMVSLQELQNEVTTPECPPVPQKYNAMVGKLKDAGIDIISSIPQFRSVKDSLYRKRNSSAQVQKLQNKNVHEVEVPPRYHDFLLAEYASEDMRILVFSSDKARETMCELTDFSGDGTFKSCHVPFDQLYTIHGDTGSTVNHTNIIPLVYALMSHRNAEAYVILFNMIKSQLPNWNPIKFKVDYEKAAMRAIATVFPSTTVKGCYYHYNKAIFKKGRELQMTNAQEPKKKRMVSLTAVLPLLPEQEIMNGWEYIISRYNGDDRQTQKFVKYMEKQWLREELLKVWSAFGETHRTTNFIEGWHNKLNKAVGKKNPNLMQLLKILKEDSALYTVRNIQRQNNIESSSMRSKKSVLIDEFIQEAQMEFVQGAITVGTFLEIYVIRVNYDVN